MEERSTPSDELEGRPGRTTRFRRPFVRIGGALALGAIAAVVTWALIDRSHSRVTSTTAPTVSTATPTVRPIDPIALSAQGLRKLAASLNQPIYWAGPEPGYRYELTRTSAGKVFVRYLPAGVKAGTTQSTYLIVATYPFRKAFDALERLPGGHPISIPRGGVAIVDTRHSTSVHIAFPGVDYQVEVYDPKPARALAVARSDALEPVPPAG
jgi:hypothetical protein